MSSQKRLLVLVDGSERTVQTVNYVKDFMPVDENTRIVLFHALSGIPEEYRKLEKAPACTEAVQQLRTRETEEKRKIRVHLEQVKKNLIATGFPEPAVEIKLNSLETGVARDIIKEAKNGYTAIVLRRRGMGSLKNIILGSVAVKLLQSLTFIPIIMVGETSPVKKILLAVDASTSSMKAVEFVASLLGAGGYEACIFHAIPGLGAIDFELPEDNDQESPEARLPDTCVQAFKLRVTRLFQDIENRLMASGFESEKISKKIVSGVYSRSDAIVKEAEEGGYSSIVVGRRGLSKVKAFFMGRVGHEVVYGGKKFTVWVV
jgi:nucleotide-binding universal stress UspA family protein